MGPRCSHGHFWIEHSGRKLETHLIVSLPYGTGLGHWESETPAEFFLLLSEVRKKNRRRSKDRRLPEIERP